MRGKSEQKIQKSTRPDATNVDDVRHEAVVGFERGDFGGPVLGNSSHVKKKKKKKENNSTTAKESFRRKNFSTSQKKYSKTSKSNASQPRSGRADFAFDKEAKGQASNEVGTALFKMVNKAFAADLTKEEPSRKEEEKCLQKVGEEEVIAASALLDTDKEIENFFHSRAEPQGQEVGELAPPKTKTASEYNLCRLPKKPVNTRIQSLNNILSYQAQSASSDAVKLKNSFGCLLSIRRLVEEKSQNLSFSNFPKNQPLPIKSVSVETGASPEKSVGSFKSFKKKGRSTSFSSERVVEVPEAAGSSSPRTSSAMPKPPTPSKSLPRVRNFGLRKTLSSCPQSTVTWDEGKELHSSRLRINEEKPAPDDGKCPAEENTSKEGHAPEKKEDDVCESPRSSRTKGNNKKVCVYNCAATKDFNQKFLKSIYIPTTGPKAGKNQKRLRKNEGAAKGSKFSIRPSVLGKQNQPAPGGKVCKTFKATTKPAAKSNASNSSRIPKKTTASATSGNQQANKPANQYQEEKSSKNPDQGASGLPPVAQAKSTTKEEPPTSPSTSQVKCQKTKTKVMKELEVLEKLFSKLKNLQSSMERRTVLDEKKELLKSLGKTYSSASKLNSPECKKKKSDTNPPENDLVLRQRKSIRTAIIHHVRNWLKLEFAYH